MPKPEWGNKQLCPECGAKFYDFRKDPIQCPKCGHTWAQAAVAKPRRAAPARSRVKDTKEQPPAAEEDEDDIEDDETESLEDVSTSERKTVVRKRAPSLDEDVEEDEEDDLPDLDDDAEIDDDEDDPFLSDEEEEDDDLSDVIPGSKDDDDR